MVEYLELLTNPRNSKKAVVMRRAAKLRAQGLSPSEALSEAWGGHNPARGTATTIEPSALTWTLLLCGAGYIGWCFYKKTKSGTWSWTPWKPNLQRRVLLSHNPGHSVVTYRPNPDSGEERYDWNVLHARGTMTDSPPVCPGGREPTSPVTIRNSEEPVRILTRGTNYG